MSTHRLQILCIAALLTAGLTAHRAPAQSNISITPQRGGTGNSPGASPNLNPTAVDPRDHANVPPELATRMAAARNDERQKRLVADTEKLLALATSLKADVDKTDKNILSLDVIRRSEEIEKLAKSIRERAKN